MNYDDYMDIDAEELGECTWDTEPDWIQTFTSMGMEYDEYHGWIEEDN